MEYSYKRVSDEIKLVRASTKCRTDQKLPFLHK
jgi:hypothetical protein